MDILFELKGEIFESAMVKVVNVVWVDATNKNFIKSMQQKKEKV